jgi:hypothetical protein
MGIFEETSKCLKNEVAQLELIEEFRRRDTISISALSASA